MSGLYIVSCTKKPMKEFYEETPLGKSILKLELLDTSYVHTHIFTDNTRGLCECYNEAIEHAIKTGVDDDTNMIFVHDDVYIEDIFIEEKLEKAFKKHDIIGMAGAVKWTLKHPTVWTNTECDRSGVVPHIINGEYRVVQFGRYSINCIVLDGLLITCKLKTLRESGLRYDERLKFHHYDIDFCLTAKKLGLTMSTAPLWVTHCSQGEWQNDPIWHKSEEVMLKKWKK